MDSPQAFGALRRAGLRGKAPEKTLLVVDHNVPTSDRTKPNPDPESAAQIAYFAENARLFGLEYYDEFDKRQGICHVVGPEQGFTLPGTMLVCGDSHTTTHGAFGALAFGIGTSEVEHVLATQTLIQRKSKNMRVVVDGKLPPDVTAKDMILAIIGEIGAAGGIGHALEFCRRGDPRAVDGRPHDGLQHVGRGGRAGPASSRPTKRPTNFSKDRPKSPKGKAGTRPCAIGRRCAPTRQPQFDREIRLNVGELPPLVTWGTSPEQVTSITGRVPKPAEIADESKRRAAERSLAYMGLKGGERIVDIAIDRVFIGSCTNARIEDLREVARVVDGKMVNPNVSAMIVPGSGLVKEQAEAEGLAQDLREGRLRLARARLLDVPRDESRQAQARRALRLDLEPQFRGPSGPSRAARIWYHRRWRLRLRSPAGLSMYGGGASRPSPKHHCHRRGQRKSHRNVECPRLAFVAKGFLHQRA